MKQTVTVQGFAWSDKTRCHSDKVIHEATNIVTAEAWIERNSVHLLNLTILSDNTSFLMLRMLAASKIEDEVAF
jgi:hypothetical protein